MHYSARLALRPLWPPPRPTDDVFLQIPVGHIAFARRDTPAHRDAGLVHRLRSPGDQRVPPSQIAPLPHDSVAAGRRQPREPSHIARCKPYAVLHLRLAVRVVGAAAGMAVKKPTCDAGEHRFVGVLISQLIEAAAAAAVAQALPLGFGHLAQSLHAPEWGYRIRHYGVLASRARLIALSRRPEGAATPRLRSLSPPDGGGRAEVDA